MSHVPTQSFCNFLETCEKNKGPLNAPNFFFQNQKPKTPPPGYVGCSTIVSFVLWVSFPLFCSFLHYTKKWENFAHKTSHHHHNLGWVTSELDLLKNNNYHSHSLNKFIKSCSHVGMHFLKVELTLTRVVRYIFNFVKSCYMQKKWNGMVN